MVINNTVVELYYLIVHLHYLIIIIINSLMERKSESDVKRIHHSKNDIKWPHSWWIMHLFTMRCISSPEIPCLCINCRFLVWYKSLYVYEIVLSCCSLNCKCISSVLHLYPPLLMISDFGIIVVCMISYLYYLYAFTGKPCHLWYFCFRLQSSKLYGTGTKTEIQISGTG